MVRDMFWTVIKIGTLCLLFVKAIAVAQKDGVDWVDWLILLNTFAMLGFITRDVLEARKIAD